ncbi:hypothetical protein EV363DRAFT_1167453 [Boletus edulis]|nr:hypothetical protein EV363DRAFT_1167453 [Boletus edulis]
MPFLIRERRGLAQHMGLRLALNSAPQPFYALRQVHPWWIERSGSTSPGMAFRCLRLRTSYTAQCLNVHCQTHTHWVSSGHGITSRKCKNLLITCCKYVTFHFHFQANFQGVHRWHIVMRLGLVWHCEEVHYHAFINRHSLV